MPFMPDPLGNVNNWLYVRQPDAAGYGFIRHSAHVLAALFTAQLGPGCRCCFSHKHAQRIFNESTMNTHHTLKVSPLVI